MAMKSICAKLGAVVVCTAVAFVGSRIASPPLIAAPTERSSVIPSPDLSPSVLVQLPGGSSMEISGDKKGSVTDEDGTLSIVGGTNLKIAGRVPWKGEAPKFWSLTFYWTVKEGKESQIGSSIVKMIKIEDGMAEVTCDFLLGQIPTTKNCRMKIAAYDGSGWKEVDVLEGITIVKK
jgi:hypothetical protein